MLLVGHVDASRRIRSWSDKRWPKDPSVLSPPYSATRPLVELELTERQWVATVLLLVWVKLMDPLQSVFQDVFLLVKMITLMIGKCRCQVRTCSHQEGTLAIGIINQFCDEQ